MKGKKLLIIVILTVLAILGGGVYTYFCTDLFKTPEQLFKKYLLSNIFQLSEINIKPFDEIYERMQNEVTQYNIGYDIGEYEGYINLETIIDIPNENQLMKISVTEEDINFFEGELAISKKACGIKIPQLYDKFISVENRDLKKLAKQFDLPEETIKIIPDKIPETSDFTDKEKEQIVSLIYKYLNKVMAQFEETSYMAEKKINVSINSQDLITDKYTFTVDCKKITVLATQAISEFLADPELTEICKDKIDENILKDLSNQYNKKLKELNINELENKQMKISLYALNGKTVKTDIEVPDSSTSFMIENATKESIITIVSVESKNNNREVGMTNYITIKNTFENNQGEMIVEAKIEYNKEDIAVLNDKAEENYFSSIYDYQEIYEDDVAIAKLKTKKVDENTITGTLIYEEETNQEETNEVKFEYKFNTNKEILEMTSENSIIINDYTTEDFSVLGQEILQNAFKTAKENPQTFIGSILNPFLTLGFSSEENNNDYTTTVSLEVEIEKQDIESAIKNGINDCLMDYKLEYMNNPEANIGDFLTVENIQKDCVELYELELIDGNTIKCIVKETENEYYAKMNIDSNNLVVDNIEVLTENEYLQDGE